MQKRPLLFLMLVPFLAGCRKAETPTAAPAAAPAVQANVVTVEARPFTAMVAVTGTLVSNAHVDVKAETTGRILKFPKEEGERVRAGEPILWVDDENHRLAVRQAETSLKVAEASVSRARIAEAHSKYEYERAQNLLKSGGITDKDLRAAQLADEDSRAQTLVAVAQFDQARTALETAQKRLRDAVVHAPVSGEIQRKAVNPGAYVEPPTLVFTLVDNSRLELEAPVPAADLAPIRPGQKVIFTVNSFPGTEFEGRVVELNPAVDAETRSAKVRIQADNRAGRLKAGMFAEGRILTGVDAQAILIPTAAAYRDDRSSKQSYVFLLENGKAVRRSIRIGRELENQLEITEGLKPGDRLIAEQSIEIAEGVAVTPRGGQR